jgi:hypothetical protein
MAGTVAVGGLETRQPVRRSETETVSQRNRCFVGRQSSRAPGATRASAATLIDPSGTPRLCPEPHRPARIDHTPGGAVSRAAVPPSGAPCGHLTAARSSKFPPGDHRDDPRRARHLRRPRAVDRGPVAHLAVAVVPPRADDTVRRQRQAVPPSRGDRLDRDQVLHRGEGAAPTPSWPWMLRPQANSLPSASSAMLCADPAAAATTPVRPGTRAGVARSPLLRRARLPEPPPRCRTGRGHGRAARRPRPGPLGPGYAVTL